jgi:hypothetical protein
MIEINEQGREKRWSSGAITQQSTGGLAREGTLELRAQYLCGRI